MIAAFRANGGVLEPGLDLLLLHHVGARSGRERITPLAYWRLDDTTVAVLASNRGAPKHPNWYYNLVANPVAKAEIGTETFLARARVAVADERRKLLLRIVAQTPSVSAAINRTSREIPIVILLISAAPTTARARLRAASAGTTPTTDGVACIGSSGRREHADRTRTNTARCESRGERAHAQSGYTVGIVPPSIT